MPNEDFTEKEMNALRDLYEVLAHQARRDMVNALRSYREQMVGGDYPVDVVDDCINVLLSGG